MAKFRMLFVCMGNICRSPAAEGVMRHLVEKEGLGHRIECDSAGTLDYHTGEPPDWRMRRAAAERGIQVDGSARSVRRRDLEDFDLILTMDDENLDHVQSLDEAGNHAHKIQPFCDYLSRTNASEVPDPYYGGLRGFERVLDLLEDGCEGLLKEAMRRLED